MALSRSTTVFLVLAIASTIILIATLAVAIAIVVKVYQNDESTSTSTQPTVKQYTPAQIVPSNPKYEGFKNAADRLKLLMKLEVDPCDDFYTFTCGNYAGDLSFNTRQQDDYEIMLTKFEDNSYASQINLPKPVKEMLKYYTVCKNTDISLHQNNVTYVNNFIANFKAATNISFPLVDGSNQSAINKEQLGKAIGYMWGTLNIPTFLTPWVDTHWRVPKRGYVLLFDQSTLFYGNNFYLKAWDQIYDSYKAKIVHAVRVLQPDIDETILNQDIEAIFKLEKEIATNFATNETMKRLYARQFNMYTLDMASSNFKFIDWKSMLQEVSKYADDEVKSAINSADFQFVIQEPDVLDRLGKALNKEPFSARTIANYFNIRLVLNYYQFIQNSSESKRWNYVIQFPQFGMRKEFWRHPLPLKLVTEDRRFDCIEATMNNLQYSNARLFLDAYYADRGERNQLRSKVAQLTDSILVTFRGMLDQLDWMDDLTKSGAYDKINYLVKNMAYPDFITNDGLLTDYYSHMEPFDDNDSLIDMNDKIFRWSMWKTLSRLNRSEYQRDHFDLPPGLVNAWYLPELNSLTLPLATLGPPFYHPNWPASLNYGSLGVIAGHELTHGFDDEGVQWDGVGTLYQWMQNNSYDQFKAMAKCVIDEYSEFSFPIPGMPNLSGEQTQGENIADNGGIHAAFRAYKNYVNLFGDEPLLDDPVLSQFTHDQLFFVGFAQVWCESNATKYGTLEHDLTNPHSPSIFRVLGTIQNFPAFKNAFNCPLNKKYTPEKHCNVWVSNITSDYGFPPSQTPKKVLNVPNPVQIPLDNTTKSKAYVKAVQYLQDSMDFTQDPCNNFYEYACGNFKKDKSFNVMRENNYRIMAAQMEKDDYSNSNSTALKKTVWFYNKCKEIRQDFQAAIANGTALKTIMKKFTDSTGIEFSMVTQQNISSIQYLSPSKLGTALGYLSRIGVDTLVTPMVDTNWPDPQNYIFFLDQNTLYYEKSYYQEDAWKTIEDSYKNDTIELLYRYAKLLKGNELDKAKLGNDVQMLLDFERTLALKYSTDETERRKYNHSLYNYKGSEDRYSFINFASYFNALSEDTPGLTNYFGTPNFYVMEDEKIRSLSQYFKQENISSIAANYLSYRLLAAFRDYLPHYQGSNIVLEQSGFGRPRRKGIFRKNFGPIDVVYEDARIECAYETLTRMQYANARFYIDYLYPTKENREEIIKGTDQMVTSILKSFQGMLTRLPWIYNETMDGAQNKINNLVKNYAFPNFIIDNAKLDKYYEKLQLQENESYFDMREKLDKFNFYLAYKVLVNKENVSRNDFLGAPGTVNAWYQPELNSITFPAGILMPPFFDLNWPASLNFGGLGVVIGHELTHGFDDEGIQWDGMGALKNWMSNNSIESFNKMAKCVQEEYHRFCPLNNTGLLPSCINGNNTQGENIADNGGIHAAWNSYKDYIALHGPDPRLPDPTMGQISHDQLFFLSFAQVWCQRPPTNDNLYTQIMTDVHSPSKYRVLGTIQNFPAFRTAFNCPLKSIYSPDNHCSVWVPEVNS